MSNIKIAAIVGSLRKESINRKYLHALVRQAPDGVTVTELDISKLPVYNQDFDDNYPKAAIDLKEQIKSADAILLVTPEHNRSTTAALKNALDWASRPWGHSVWSDKPVAVTGATGGGIGTFGAQNDLRQMLTFLGTYTLAKPELYFSTPGNMSDEGEIINDHSKELIDSFWAAFVEWIGRFQD